MSVRLLADMGLAQSVVDGLRQLGYDAIHLRERLPVTADDSEVLDLAVKERRTVMTMDHDFGNLLFARRLTAPSVIFFRVSDERPGSILRRLELILPTIASELFAGSIVVVEDSRVRMRRLPIRRKE